MRLQKLTSLETQKIIEELQQLMALIAELKDLLASEEKILQLVKKELLMMADQYGDARKTEIVLDEVESINIEDLIQKEDMVVILTNRGYIKRVPYSAYRLQGRGGKGSSTSTLKDDDYIKNLFISSTHDIIMFMTSEGRAYWLKVHEIPEGSRIAKGTHIRSLLNITANELITATVSLKKFSDDTFLFIATAKGTVKKVPTNDFIHAKIRGVVAILLRSDDRVISAILTSGTSDIFIVSRQGKGLRFSEDEVRAMGRAAQGVGGLRLLAGDEVAGVIETNEQGQAMLLSTNGYGKRLAMADIAPHGRNTQGRWVFDTSEKTGEVVGVVPVEETDDIMAVTSQGSSIKVPVNTVPIYNPNTQGVRIVNIQKPDYVVGVDKPTNDGEEDIGENGREASNATDSAPAETPSSDSGEPGASE
jgi:DNA gyrase subunit A